MRAGQSGSFSRRVSAVTGWPKSWPRPREARSAIPEQSTAPSCHAQAAEKTRLHFAIDRGRIDHLDAGEPVVGVFPLVVAADYLDQYLVAKPVKASGIVTAADNVDDRADEEVIVRPPHGRGI